MNIEYISPVERAWERCRAMLLGPFAIERWLVLGWTAFLAGLGGGVGGWNPSARVPFLRLPDDRDLFHSHEAADVFRDAFFLGGGFSLALVSLLVLTLLLWVSSRGKFIFLENVIHGRAEFLDPWRRSSSLGWSLFLWRLGFMLAAVIASVLISGPILFFSGMDGGVGRLFSFPLIASAGLLGMLLGLAVAFIGLCLNDFVVPVMAAYDLSATEGWRRFLPLLRGRPKEFLLYALLVLFALITLAVVMMVLSLATCCVLPFLLAIPYVGSVILLPISATYRQFSLEFLAQFGPEWDFRQPPPTG